MSNPIPAFVHRVPDLTGRETVALGTLDTKIRAHRQRNWLRTLLYEGKHAVSKVGSVIPAEYTQTAKIIGWPAKSVDMLAERTPLLGFDWPDGDITSLGVDDIWLSNQLAIEAPMASVSSLLHGVAFLTVSRGDTRSGEPAAQIHCVEATDGSGEWNPRTRRLDSFLQVHSRDEHDQVSAFTLMVDGQIVSARLEDRRWHVQRSTYVGPVPVEPLSFKPRPGKRLGSSRITRPAIGLTSAAMRVAIRVEGNADVYALPQLFLLGADNRIFKNPDGTIKAAWQVALGRMFGIPDDDKAAVPRAQIQVVQAASPTPHLEQLKQYAQLFSGETSIPVSSLGVSDMANPTSADSYAASREDLVATAETATDVWGVGWSRAMARAIGYTNGLDVPDPRWSSIMPLWRPPQYSSRAAQADAGTKQLSAVPWLADTEVGLELLGLDDTQIQRALGERGKAEAKSMLDQLLSMPDEPVDEAVADDAEPSA